MLKFPVLLLSVVSVLFAAASTDVKTTTKAVAVKTVSAGPTKTDVRIVVVAETTKVIRCDTLLAIKYDTTKFVSTLKDTVKTVKIDTVKSTSKVDTVKVKK
jgi:hypothetical protein